MEIFIASIFVVGVCLFFLLIGILVGMRVHENIWEPWRETNEEYVALLNKHADARSYLCSAIIDNCTRMMSVAEWMMIVDQSLAITSGKVLYDPETKMFSNVYEDKNPQYISPKTDWI